MAKSDLQDVGNAIASDAEQIIMENYKKVTELEDKLKSLKNRMKKTEPDKKGGMVALANTAKEWGEIVKECQQLVMDASGVLSMPSNFQNSKAYEIILKKMQILLYETKKLILTIQKRVEVASKQCVTETLNGKGTADLSMIAVPLITFQLISTLINTIQTAITMLCNLFVPPIRVAPEGLSFFLTPKSLVTTELTIINPLQCCLDNIPEPIKLVIDIAIQAVETANNAIKIANIALGASNAVAMVSTGSPMLDQINFCPNLSKINANVIFQAVNLILNLQILPLPVPRFEKLHLLNLGYLTWLITGYEPGAKKTFGIPGMP